MFQANRRQLYVYIRADNMYVVSVKQNPGEWDDCFLVKYNGYIKTTYAIYAHTFRTEKDAIDFGNQYLNQNPKEFKLVSKI